MKNVTRCAMLPNIVLGTAGEEEAMKLCAVRDALISVFDLHSIAADRFVRALQEAGALPSIRAGIDAEQVARLMLAVLAAPTPSEAVEALAIFEQLELLVVERRQRTDGGTLTVTEDQIVSAADVPTDIGGAELFSLASALPLVLEMAKTTELTLCRTAAFMIVSMGTVRLLYGARNRSASCEAACFDVWVSLTGSGIEQIGALLTERPPVALAEGQPEPVFH